MSANQTMEELANNELVQFARLLERLELTHADLSPVFGPSGMYVFCAGRADGKICPSRVAALYANLAAAPWQNYRPADHRCGVLLMTRDGDHFLPLEALLNEEAA
ncbi:MAG: hypothetical protein JSS83_17965 [Cyanobacteria bacterium SZAS LIN-3]|nr:hypothetical protein [Cyanobacteria bacterium SZAS LIN-3]